MSKEIQKQLNQITETIVQNLKPERVILFGSYASGKPKAGSDFDIFIVKETKLRSIDRDREIRRILPRDRKRGVDLIVLTPQEVDRALVEKNIFLGKILKEGKELYVKDQRNHRMA